LYDGKDRWYLEALGIGASKKWDECLDAWLAKVGDDWNSPGGRDIIWRSRAKKTPEYLAKILLDPATPEKELDRYFRAFDFQVEGKEKQEALIKLAVAEGLGRAERRGKIANGAIARLKGVDLKHDLRFSNALNLALDNVRGTAEYVDLVHRFDVKERFGDLLKMAQKGPAGQLGSLAMRVLIAQGAKPQIESGIANADPAIAQATIDALGTSGDQRAVDYLLPVVKDAQKNTELRKAAARSLGKTQRGAKEVLDLAKSKTIDLDIAAGAAMVLHAAPWSEIRAEAIKMFPPPPSKNNQPLPPIAELVKRGGNAGLGREIFMNAGTCAKCHQVGSEGKEVGPNLSEIGAKLSRHALYESILFPSAGISHSFETYAVRLADGNTVTGVLVSRTPQEVALKGEDAIVRTFKTDEIGDLKKQPTSLMPADLQKLMTAEELADVVEYMTTLKKK
jgi:putative heme-binding domain-containing protein